MVSIDSSRCTGCGACVADCPTHALTFAEQKALYSADSCLLCGHCLALCPEDAVRITGYDDPVEAYHPASFDLSPDTLLRALRFRRSCRQFTADSVSQADLERILEAGRAAPTAKNRQDTSYLVFTQELDTLRALAVDCLNRFLSLLPAEGNRRFGQDGEDTLFYHAPAVILTVSDHDVNAALASANMELMAHAMGLGALYVGFFVRAAAHSRELQQFLGLSGKQHVVTCLALGHPVQHYCRTAPRKPAEVLWR